MPAMLLQRRDPPPSISYPIPQDNTSSASHPYFPVSPLRSPPPQSRLPGMSHLKSNPRTWLSRSSSQTHSQTRSESHAQKSLPYSPSKPVRISEPKFVNSLDILIAPRSGALGTGATIVRTPQEALAGSALISFQEEGEAEEEFFQELDVRDPEDGNESELPSPPESPPLPPIPMSKGSPVALTFPDKSDPPQPTRRPPPPPSHPTVDNTPIPAPASAPTHSTLRPSLKSPLPSYFAPVPPISATDVTATSAQLPFDAILISPMPTSAIDKHKIIVSLETSTQTYRTTLNTLTSRSSHLGSYILSLLPSRSKLDDDRSIHSQSSEPDSVVPDTPDSAFNSIFHNHLTSAGLLPQFSSTAHVFLDRPSAPYAHILAYLRTPSSFTPTLPLPVRLLSTSRLEALLELRDEAQYLGLDELHKLCVDEVQLRQRVVAPSAHFRGQSSSSTYTLRDSTPSAHLRGRSVATGGYFMRQQSAGSVGSDTLVTGDLLSLNCVCRSQAAEIVDPIGLRSRSASSVRTRPVADWI